MISAFVDVHLK